MQVEVDKLKCIGCGACAAICPEVFEITEQGKSKVVKASACDECDCRSAAHNCPVGAISLEGMEEEEEDEDEEKEEDDDEVELEDEEEEA